MILLVIFSNRKITDKIRYDGRPRQLKFKGRVLVLKWFHEASNFVGEFSFVHEKIYTWKQWMGFG